MSLQQERAQSRTHTCMRATAYRRAVVALSQTARANGCRFQHGTDPATHSLQYGDRGKEILYIFCECFMKKAPRCIVHLPLLFFQEIQLENCRLVTECLTYCASDFCVLSCFGWTLFYFNQISRLDLESCVNLKSCNIILTSGHFFFLPRLQFLLL